MDEDSKEGKEIPAILRILREMGDLLEIQGANPFEIMAYRNGADQLEEWDGDFEAAVKEGNLTQIPRIGKGLAQIIGDLARTGRSPQHQQLRASFPGSLLDLRYVTGLGPKKIKALHDQLGIQSLDDLEEAARTERIRTLRGFGAKTEESILNNLDRARERKARYG